MTDQVTTDLTGVLDTYSEIIAELRADKLRLEAQLKDQERIGKQDADTIRLLNKQLGEWHDLHADRREHVEMLAEQLAWFRREHVFQENVLYYVKTYRNGTTTQQRLWEIIRGEDEGNVVGEYMRFRNPHLLPPHLSRDSVVKELEAAQERLGFNRKG